jgi:hypothetical protein
MTAVSQGGLVRCDFRFAGKAVVCGRYPKFPVYHEQFLVRPALIRRGGRVRHEPWNAECDGRKLCRPTSDTGLQTVLSARERLSRISVRDGRCQAFTLCDRLCF